MRRRGDCCQRSRQRGVSLVIALFILVVLALLGAAMINMLAGGADSAAREVISARALFVAESGAQRKLSEIFPPGTTSSVPGACTAENWSSADLGGIAGCGNLQVTIACSLAAPAGADRYYTITSSGRCGPSGDAAVRVVEVQARDGL